MATRPIDHPKEWVAYCDECGRDSVVKAFTPVAARKEAILQGFRWVEIASINYFLCPECKEDVCTNSPSS